MKRLFWILLLFGFMLIIPQISSAFEISNDEMEITYDLSDKWQLTSNERVISCIHKDNASEGINIVAIKNNGAYVFEQANKEILYDLCRETFSDSFLSRYWSDIKEIDVTAQTTDEKVKYETYNNTKYYRYEKTFNIKGNDNFYSNYYATVFATTKNGRIYFIKYMRDDKEGHMNDCLSLINSISFKPGEIVVEYNGEIIEFDREPVMINEKTMVPLRNVAEKMGYRVDWIANKKTIVMSTNVNGDVYKFFIGSSVAVKNHIEQINLSDPVSLIGDTTYVPLRSFAESLDANVNWIGEQKKVQIIKNWLVATYDSRA